MKGLGIVLLLTGSVLAMPDQEKFAHVTQDSVDLDLSSGEIYFNGEPMDTDQFYERVKGVYSIAVNASFWSEEDGAVDDLFGELSFAREAAACCLEALGDGVEHDG